MISNGKAIVENNATPQKVEQFKNQCKSGKVSTKDGRQVRASLDNFAKNLRGSNLQAATPKKGEQFAPIVDEEKHGQFLEALESKKSNRPSKVNPFTSCEVGKGEHLFTLKMPKVNSDKALHNFRELCAKVESHYGWALADVYPTLQKVTA